MNKKISVIVFVVLSVFFIPFSVLGITSDYVQKWNFENTYIGTNQSVNLSAGGSGNIFNNTIYKVGNYSLYLNGNGYANSTGTVVAGGNTDFTMCTWFRQSSQSGYLMTSGCASGYTTGCFAIMGLSTGNINFYGLSNDLTFTKTFQNDVWHHACFTYTGSTKNVVLYLNGSYVSNQTLSSNMNLRNDNTSVMTIGVSTDRTGSRFTGFIDDARWYNRALNSTDIMNIYTGDSTYYNYSLKYQVNFNGSGLSGAVVRTTDLSTNTSFYNVTNSSGGLKHYLSFNGVIPITPKYYEVTAWIDNNFTTRGISNFVYLNTYD